MGTPGGPTEDTMRMIREETQVLHALAEEHPELAAEAEAIGRRYAEMANRLRLGMH